MTIILNPRHAFTGDAGTPEYAAQVAAFMAQEFGGEWETAQTARGFWYARRSK
jgi:hypothetical protein